jgi:hypothetical protein
MSTTIYAPFKEFGENGDYPIEVNFAVRIYDDKGERIPAIGEIAASLKGGQRTNHIGIVPLLNGNKKEVGKAAILKIISAKPQHISLEDLKLCGFNCLGQAIEYVEREHLAEFARDGVFTIFHFKVVELFE